MQRSRQQVEKQKEIGKRDNKALSNAKALVELESKALTNAKALIAKHSVNTVSQQDSKESNTIQSDLDDPLAAARVSYKDMLDFSMYKNQVINVVHHSQSRFQYPSDFHPALVALAKEIEDPSIYIWDNAATLSVAIVEASRNLINLETLKNAGPVGGYTGASATPIARGQLSNFPIEGFWIYVIPGSKTNIISLIDVDNKGGAYSGKGGKLKVVWNSNGKLISETTRQTNGIQQVPQELTESLASNRDYEHFVHSTAPNYSSSLQLQGITHTKEQLYRMKMGYDIHVFFLHLGWNFIKQGIRYHIFGKYCILVESDIDRLLAFIGDCAICKLGKMKQLSMATPSQTYPDSLPGEKWSWDLQDLPPKHHGGFKVISIFRDDSTGLPRYFPTFGKDEESLMRTIMQLISFCTKFERKIRIIVPDAEACLVGLTVHCGHLGIQITPIPAKEHGHASERSIQTIDNLVTCAISAMSQKFKPELTFYAKQAAAAAIALNCCISKNGTTSAYTVFTGLTYEYHAKHPYVPFGSTVLSEVGDAHRLNESNKTGIAFNNSPKCELGVCLGPDLYGTQKGCYLILPASGHMTSRRNFDPVNALMTGWQINFPIKQSVRQYEIIEDELISDNKDSPLENQEGIQLADKPIDPLESIRHLPTILKPTEIPVSKDFYSASLSSPQPTSDNLSDSNVTDADNWTTITSKRSEKVKTKPPVQRESLKMVTRQDSKGMVSLTTIQPLPSAINLKNEIKTEFSFNQANKIPRIQPKLKAAVDKELLKIDKFTAGIPVDKKDIPKGATLLDFLFRVKEKRLLTGELLPTVNGRMVIDGLRQKRNHTPEQLTWDTSSFYSTQYKQTRSNRIGYQNSQ